MPSRVYQRKQIQQTIPSRLPYRPPDRTFSNHPMDYFDNRNASRLVPPVAMLPKT